MLVTALKKAIEALPGNLFTQTWTAIEEIDTALGKAGPAAVIALNYVNAVHQKHLADIISSQEARLSHLVGDAKHYQQQCGVAFEENEKLKENLLAANKKIASLKKKNKK